MFDDIYQHPKIYDILYADKAYAGESEFLVKHINSNTTDAERILVVGCGTGGHVKYLNDHYDIVAIDKSEAMIKHARDQFDSVDFRAEALPGLSVEGPFDAILLPYYVVNYIPVEALEQGIAELDDLLASDGVIILDWAEKKSEQNLELTVRRTDDADYCFLTSISPLSDCEDHYVHVMLSDRTGNEDKGADLTLFEETIRHHDWLVLALQELGYDCETYDGYGTDDWLDSDITVCVASK